jgi:hypothetical protein
MQDIIRRGERKSPKVRIEIHEGFEESPRIRKHQISVRKAKVPSLNEVMKRKKQKLFAD